jgi:CBS domain-containing protein
MRVSDIMTPNVVCCDPDTSLEQVARLMVQHNCGAIPVCDADECRRVVGMVTDRDITCRVVAAGKNPLELTAKDCMTHPVATVQVHDSLEHLCKTLENNQIRRVVVVDHQGALSGVVAQADIARKAPIQETGEVVREVSQPD